jgi:hypothetical protein
MSQATGYILPLTERRLERLRDELPLSGRFAEAVPAFAHPRKSALVTFVLDSARNAIYLARGRRGIAAGTDLSRLNLEDVQELEPPLPIHELSQEVPARFRHPLLSRLDQGGLLTVKQFQVLVDVLVHARDDLGPVLARFSSAFRGRIEELSQDAKTQLAGQKEALGTALNIGGFDRRQLLDWMPHDAGRIDNFLDGLPQARVREDQVVANDLVNFPGFSFVNQDITGRAIFEGENGRMAVILANRLPLEQLTGTDLIYYNASFHSFVMVQYKMMECSTGGAAIFRLPSQQLEVEVRRMEALLQTIAHLEATEDPSGFRFNFNPFFLKFCPRLIFEPEDSGLSKGMYIPLGHFVLLARSGRIAQTRGGDGITYSNVGRYLDNTGFATLVAGGWIGTNQAQTAIVQEAIRETLTAGRAAVLAIHTNREVHQTPKDEEAVPSDGSDDLPF